VVHAAILVSTLELGYQIQKTVLAATEGVDECAATSKLERNGTTEARGRPGDKG
jgi:hypothetical protein